ncbi:ABC transporter ATP-binding protein [Alicyclobacillus dauci]|uniref:ABC transporter ATP-binding protein n=1 Tax=Alicyclobacillus dauci TaxID=1475485 RepID=A0ABY6Z3I2_9BACL|nr:ABC transporter ATP-binding protein [Alicyclobacillus dauci]WAH37183.1 ABC transporter ATP-binding protein [Alicyclobacillus dauci]
MSDYILELNNVLKIYRKKKQGKKEFVRAANDVSIQLKPNKILALVGESGSGKTTLARLVTGIERADEGEIRFHGEIVSGLAGRRLADYRRRVQMVFQDPFASINPLNSVYYTLSRPLANYVNLSGKALRARVLDLLRTVHLTPAEDFQGKLPYELSGGQLQRVGIARALAPGPELIVADEPVSMLDVSIRAEVLQLLGELRDSHGVSVVYITHDLVSARILADEIVVLYRGTVVERGNANTVVRFPKHPYTRLLLSSIPDPWHPDRETTEDVAQGEMRETGHGGCVFADRCVMAMDKCRQGEPRLARLSDQQHVSCFLYTEEQEDTLHEPARS